MADNVVKIGFAPLTKITLPYREIAVHVPPETTIDDLLRPGFWRQQLGDAAEDLKPGDVAYAINDDMDIGFQLVEHTDDGPVMRPHEPKHFKENG